MGVITGGSGRPPCVPTSAFSVYKMPRALSLAAKAVSSARLEIASFIGFVGGAVKLAAGVE